MMQETTRIESNGRTGSGNSLRRPAAAALLGLVAGGWLAAAPAPAEDVNRVVLRINDEIITLYDYEVRKTGEITRILADPGLTTTTRQEMLERVGRETMKSLFNETLLLSFANQQAVRVSDQEIDEAIEEIKNRQGIKSREELDQALASFGLTYEQLRANTRRDLLWSEVVGREVNAKVEIGEEEVRAYYRNNAEEFRTPEQRHFEEVIVLESSERSGAELRQLAEDVHQALVAGADMASVIAPYASAGQTSGVIDLGWLRPGELEPSLKDAAWALAPGAYSTPIAARGGYHILHLAELREAQVKPFAEVQEQIMRLLRGRRFNQELRTFVAQLEQNSYIRENLPPEAVDYRSVGDQFTVEDELDIFHAPVVPPGEAPAAGEAPAGDEAAVEASPLDPDARR